MQETSKCYDLREKRGDFTRYLTGKGLDIGCGDDALKIPLGMVVPWDKEQGDAQYLASCTSDEVFDFVYSSHCLEHMRDVEKTLRNWVRVIRPGGILYVTIPDYQLYEKMRFPSRFNGDHKHTFSMELTRAKVQRANHWQIAEDITPVLERLGVDIEHVHLEDAGFNYSVGPDIDQTLNPLTLAQICIIGTKRA